VPDSQIAFTVIDSMLEQQSTLSILDVLQTTPGLSKMNSLFKDSTLESVLATGTRTPTRVCFEKHLCLKVSQELSKHFQDLASFNQFTFQLLDDSVFQNMPKNLVKRIFSSSETRNVFVQEHTFLGKLQQQQHHLDDNQSYHRIVGVSLKDKHPVAEFIPRGASRRYDVTRNGRSVFFIKKTIPVREGIAQILIPYAV